MHNIRKKVIGVSSLLSVFLLLGLSVYFYQQASARALQRMEKSLLYNKELMALNILLQEEIHVAKHYIAHKINENSKYQQVVELLEALEEYAELGKKLGDFTQRLYTDKDSFQEKTIQEQALFLQQKEKLFLSENEIDSLLLVCKSFSKLLKTDVEELYSFAKPYNNSLDKTRFDSIAAHLPIVYYEKLSPETFVHKTMDNASLLLQLRIIQSKAFQSHFIVANLARQLTESLDLWFPDTHSELFVEFPKKTPSVGEMMQVEVRLLEIPNDSSASFLFSIDKDTLPIQNGIGIYNFTPTRDKANRRTLYAKVLNTKTGESESVGKDIYYEVIP